MVKNDKLDALILLSGNVLIEKNVSLYKNTDTSTIKCPKSLDKRVQRNINKEKCKQEFGTFYKYGQRFVAALLIVCTILFAAIMSVEAVRNALLNVIIEFFDEYLSINYVVETETPKVIGSQKTPLINLENFEKQVVLDTESMYVCSYSKNNEQILMFSQAIIDENSHWFDNENTSFEKVKINNNDGILMFRKERQTYSLSWSDGVYEYSLVSSSSEISKDELISIAETIY